MFEPPHGRKTAVETSVERFMCGLAHESQQIQQRPTAYSENTGKAAENNAVLSHTGHAVDSRITCIAVSSLTDSSAHQILTPVSHDYAPTVEATDQLLQNDVNFDYSDNTSPSSVVY